MVVKRGKKDPQGKLPSSVGTSSLTSSIGRDSMDNDDMQQSIHSEFSQSTLRLNPAVVKAKGLKLLKKDGNTVLDLCNNCSNSGLSPIDDSSSGRTDALDIIKKESSHHSSKRTLRGMYGSVECCGSPKGFLDAATRDAYKMPAKQVKWWHVTLFLLNDINHSWLVLYTAIVPGMFGWVVGIVLLLGIWPINMYISHLLWRCRNLFPGAISIGDLVYYLTKSTWAMYITFFFVNLTITLHLSYLVLTAAYSIDWLADQTEATCLVLFIAIVCILLLPVTQLRSLHSLTIVNGINLLCVLCFSGIYMYFLISGGRSPGAVTSIGPPPIEWDKKIFDPADIHPILGLDTMITAYEYQLLVLEIIAEMKDPREFPKANYWCTPVVIVISLVCGLSRYYFQGTEKDLALITPSHVLSSIFDRSEAGLAYFGVTCFTLQLLGSCLIRSVILIRSIQLLVHPKAANATDWRSRFEWAAISLLLLVLVFTFAFVGGIALLLTTINVLLAIVFALLLPIILFIVCKAKCKQLEKIPWYEWGLMISIMTIIIAVVVVYFMKFSWLVDEDFGANLANVTRNNVAVTLTCNLY